MDLGEAGLREQPFRASGQPLAVTAYAAHRKALRFLQTTCAHRHGLGIVQAPTLAGKSTVIREFIGSLDRDTSTAIVNAKGLTSRGLLTSVLEQFGYTPDLTSVGELSGMLRVFGMQQTGTGHPPVIAIDGCQHLDATVLPLLCEIADIKANRQSAFRLLMACERNVEALISTPELKGIAARVTGIHRLEPMVLPETRDYLYAKLYRAGAYDPAAIFPHDVCADIHMVSGGWPGIVDRLGAFALGKARSLPVTPDLVEQRKLPEELREAARMSPQPERGTAEELRRPRLYISREGELLQEVDLDRPRLLIGRSGHNDLSLESRFISRHHALLVCHGASTLLMDLNSSNGTFVNSRRISNHVLRHEDVISLGAFRLKFMHPAAERQFELDEAGLAETVIMKTLEDMRHLLDSESTQTMPLEPLRKLGAGNKQ